MFLIQFLVVSAAIAISSAKLTFKEDGTFKILHLSDVHYRIGPR